MNAERLLEVYEQISEAPDAIARLRRFVLDLAVRGKLVEQDAGEELASNLLETIADLKAEMVHQKQIKKPKPLTPLDTFPFNLPHSWRWEKLGNLTSYIQRGKSPKYSSGSGIPVVSQKCVQWSGLDLDVAKEISAESLSNYEPIRFLRDGDLLWNSTGTGTIGRVHIVREPPEKLVCDSHVTVVRPILVSSDYLWVWLRSDDVYGQIEGSAAGSTNQIELTATLANNQPVPLPPLAEQHRIVAKVDELMALCDRLEEARKTREETRDKLTAASLARLTAPDTTAEDFPAHAAFALEALPALTTRPDQIKTLRQTILNLAVRGKLVEQDPADEPAAELLATIAIERHELAKAGKIKKSKPLPPVDVSLAPYDLPIGWSWARFPELGTFGRGKSKHRPRNDPALYRGGTVPFIQTGDVARSGGRITSNTGFYNELGLAQSMLWPCGTMCVTIAANIADSGILDFDACFPDSVVGLVPASMFDSARYFEYFIRTAKANLLEFASATAQKNINLGILETVLIPLPPLAEQHRIVAKVDALMALCDRLEAALTTTDTTRARLLEALLHEALEPSQNVMEAAE
ncbi:MAG: restriction endonuclease subunit S [Alphaproteobacteria bacterium]|nr:restriction endonuclease subunit S [Alphaproteobacteria bacterium]